MIDLFAGCGGFSLGFQQAGFEIAHGVEIDPVAAETYRRNFPKAVLQNEDIADAQVPVRGTCKPNIVIGGPPCQGFSMAGARNRKGFVGDPRNFLFKHYVDFVRELSPEVFVMENVKGIISMEKGAVFREIVGTFSDPELMGGQYHVDWKVVRTRDLGLPQRRERLILLGAKSRQPSLEKLMEQALLNLIRTHTVFGEKPNLRDALGNLPVPTTTGVVEVLPPVSSYEKYLSAWKGATTNHSASRHSRTAIERMKSVRPGENYTSLKENVSSVHSGAYGRMKWETPANTITTRFDTPAGGRFIHPEEDRTLTPREAARIQSFPDDFEFLGDRRSVARQIGNAVPPMLARLLAESVRLLQDESDWG